MILTIFSISAKHFSSRENPVTSLARCYGKVVRGTVTGLEVLVPCQQPYSEGP